MKRNRLLIILAFALVTGGIAGFLALRYLSARATPVVAQAPSGKVAVAARDLPLGVILRNEDIRLVDWPGDAIPEGYAGAPAEIVGRGVITPLKLNEPILASNLADKEAGGGLPIVIPEGMRALSIRVNDITAIAGFVIPYTRVDVLLTLGGEGRPSTTKLLLQNMLVLTAGQHIQRDPEGKPITVSLVTLLVTPEEAELLTTAAGVGTLQLTLRNTLDLAQIKTRGVSSASLMGGVSGGPVVTREVRVAPTRRAAPSGPERTGSGAGVVETYRGGVRTLSTFQQEANDTTRP